MSEWISVEDRLPDREDGADDVLLVIRPGHFGLPSVTLYDGEMRKFVEFDVETGYYEIAVTHWMPLPPSPEAINE